METKINKSNFLKQLTSIYLCTILFILPLVFKNGYYNISQAKTLCFLLLSLMFIGICLIYYLFKAIIKQKIQIKIIALDLAVFLFAMANIVSACFSKYDADVWIGRESRLQGALIIVIYAVIYFCISNNLNPTNGFIAYALISFSIVSFVALLNSLGIDLFGIRNGLKGDEIICFISTIGNINFFGAYCCLFFPVSICLYCYSNKKMSSCHFLVAVIAGSISMVLTSSESFVIGFVFFALTFPFFIFNKPKILSKYCFLSATIIFISSIFIIILKIIKTSTYVVSELLSFILHPIVALILIGISVTIGYLALKKQDKIPTIKRGYIALLVTCAITLISLFIYANYNSLGILDKYFKITDEWGTNRGWIYKNCFLILKNYSFKEWLIGIGPESIQYEFSKLGITVIDQAHNEYLQFLLTTGIIGLISYLCIIAITSVLVIKELRNVSLAISIFMGFVAYLAQASFNISQPFTAPFIYIFIAILAGIYKSNYIMLGEKNHGKNFKKQI